MMPTHAMVLAAGLGKRMRPITNTIPKPLVPVAGRTLIDRALDQIADYGIQHAVVNASYLAHLLEAHLDLRQQTEALPQITLSHETELLETGGGIRRALPLLGNGPFFSLNSDTICVDAMDATPALARMAAAWDEAHMDVLMLLHPREKAIGFEGQGDFFLRDDGALSRRGVRPSAPYVFTGVQLIHPRFFDGAPEGAFSMNVLYDRQVQPNGTLTRISALIHEGDWLHVGDPAGLAEAEGYFFTRT